MPCTNLHEASQQFEDVREKIEDLIPTLERLKQDTTVTTADGDHAEKQRRSELSRYACRSLTSPTPVNGLLSTLEEIRRRSRALLEKSIATRFVEKGEDSKEVARLIERLREAITRYQVSGDRLVASGTVQTEGQISQQQAIYDQITNLTVRTFRFVYIFYYDRSFHQDFFRYPFETPRGNGIQQTRHDAC